jgi:YbbR domain-containing protein
MINALKQAIKLLPTLLLAFLLSLTVWISAVSTSDPTEERIYPQTILIDIIGQNPSLILTNEEARQLSLTLSAPRSTWDQLTTHTSPVRALVDLSGMGAGTHLVNVQVQVNVTPVKVISYRPNNLKVTLEQLSSRNIPVQLVRSGEPATGFQVETPTLSQENANVRGPESLVRRVYEVRANLNINQVQENISREILLQAVDVNESVINNLTITPDRVVVNQPITQRGGYRNLVVKVLTSGKVVNGYRLTSIIASPPTVTVFSSNPRLVSDLPGYVETTPVNLNNLKDYLETLQPLNLPNGVLVVGTQTVRVEIGVAAIEGSITLANLPITITGLAEGLTARVLPEGADILISGPLPLLEKLTGRDVSVMVDLKNEKVGQYNRPLKVEIKVPGLTTQSVQPNQVDITISTSPTVIPTPRK